MTGKYVLGNCILIIIYSSKQESRTTKPYPIILFLGSLLDLFFVLTPISSTLFAKFIVNRGVHKNLDALKINRKRLPHFQIIFMEGNNYLCERNISLREN